MSNNYSRRRFLDHAGKVAGHAVPALCREHVGSNDVLHGPCPSLPNLRKRFPSLVRLVHRYYGTVRLLQHVHVRRSVYGLRGPALIARPRRAGDLPVLVHVARENFNISSLPEDALDEINRIQTRQRLNDVVNTGSPGFIPRVQST
jgi:hypothetical protein